MTTQKKVKSQLPSSDKTEDYVSTIRILVENGVDIETKDNHGETALMRAARKGQAEVVKTLLDAGANPSVKNHQDETALSIAEKNGRTDVSALLKSVIEKQQLLESIPADGSQLHRH